ncbi:MAG TPA: DUF1289 domain-containing protein [Reyranella sp.]|nr:DUF1289 domain-containing protein [Reyranella sp.]
MGDQPTTPPIRPRVLSPCIGICVIDQKTSLCLGCKRTIAEIGRWQMMDDESRQAVIDQLRQRKIS